MTAIARPDRKKCKHKLGDENAAYRRQDLTVRMCMHLCGLFVFRCKACGSKVLKARKYQCFSSICIVKSVMEA